MTREHVLIVYQIVAFLFAISVHESAHAWTAFRCGDPTAYMLGRVTLNPIKHIDLFGTVILPLLLAVMGAPLIGWAKPTPVNTRNFKKLVKYDILTSVAGPVSNMLVAAASIVVLAILAHASPTAHAALWEPQAAGDSVFIPIVALFESMLLINVLLAVFNLIPVPPLDGSHVVRHMLSGAALAFYDNVGRFGIFILFLVSWRTNILGAIFTPAINFVYAVLGALAR